MGAGAEGEVRPCAWKWEWKLKSRIENEEGGPRPTRSSSQQEREREREREREAERGSAQGEWYLIEDTLPVELAKYPSEVLVAWISVDCDLYAGAWQALSMTSKRLRDLGSARGLVAHPLPRARHACDPAKSARCGSRSERDAARCESERPIPPTANRGAACFCNAIRRGAGEIAGALRLAPRPRRRHGHGTHGITAHGGAAERRAQDRSQAAFVL